jgi:magnesium transporter
VREGCATNPGSFSDPKDVLLEIYATDAEYCADVLEGVHRHLKGASRSVLTREMTDKIASAVMARLAQQEDLNGNVRQNISDTRRSLSFLTRERLLTDEQSRIARQIGHDLDSLDAHTHFLFDKINFLMSAIVGFVNITQNKVVKTFSVAAVAMLPPTLIASVYGMNFERMPELAWDLGYPYALGLMVLSVILPFLWFRQRGWLK